MWDARRDTRTSLAHPCTDLRASPLVHGCTTHNMDPSTNFAAADDVSPLERDVLVQYKTLASNLQILSQEIASLNRHLPADSGIPSHVTSGSADALLGNLRNLERKIGLVYTLFRTAVYSFVLQSQEQAELEAS